MALYLCLNADCTGIVNDANPLQTKHTNQGKPQTLKVYLFNDGARTGVENDTSRMQLIYTNINILYVEPSTYTITTSHLSDTGYYGKRQLTVESPAIKITTKGWHTITLKSNNKDKFIAFGLSFMSLEDYKRTVK